jgi:hypothetical protein
MCPASWRPTESDNTGEKRSSSNPRPWRSVGVSGAPSTGKREGPGVPVPAPVDHAAVRLRAPGCPIRSIDSLCQQSGLVPLHANPSFWVLDPSEVKIGLTTLWNDLTALTQVVKRLSVLGVAVGDGEVPLRPGVLDGLGQNEPRQLLGLRTGGEETGTLFDYPASSQTV